MHRNGIFIFCWQSDALTSLQHSSTATLRWGWLASPPLTGYLFSVLLNCSHSLVVLMHPYTWSHLRYLSGPSRNLDHNHFGNDDKKLAYLVIKLSILSLFCSTWILYFFYTDLASCRVLESMIILAECQRGGLVGLSYLYMLVYIFLKSVCYIWPYLLICYGERWSNGCISSWNGE